MRKTERKGQLVELIDDHNLNPEAPPMSKRGRERREQKRCQKRSEGERGSKGDVRREATARAAT